MKWILAILILAPTGAGAQDQAAQESVWAAQEVAKQTAARASKRAYDSVWADVATQHRPDSIRAAKAAKAEAAKAKSRRPASWHPAGWTQAQVAAVRAHTVKIGMTSEMVRASIGNPDDINTTEYADSHWTAQYVYRSRSMYVYFVDGIVTVIQR